MKNVQLKTVEMRLRSRSGVFIVIRGHVSHLFLIVDFERQTFPGFILKGKIKIEILKGLKRLNMERLLKARSGYELIQSQPYR